MDDKGYGGISRHRPASRAEKRKLNRALACALCARPLGPDRYLFEARRGSSADVVAAHPACAEALAQRIAARQAEHFSRGIAAMVMNGPAAAPAALHSRYLITVTAAAARIRPA